MGITSSWTRVQRSKFWGIIPDFFLLCLNFRWLFGFPQHMCLIQKNFQSDSVHFYTNHDFRLLSSLLFERYASSVIKRESDGKVPFPGIRILKYSFNRKYRLALFFKSMPLSTYNYSFLSIENLTIQRLTSSLSYPFVYRWVMCSKSFTKDL